MPRPSPRHERAFQEWYADPERDMPKVAKSCRISERTLRLWREKYDWETRAAELDERARKKADQALVRDRAAYFKRIGKQGRLLKNKGFEYLRKTGVDNGQQAINAISAGDEMVRRALGIPDRVVAILEMTDDELDKELARYGFTLDGGKRERVRAEADKPSAT